MANGNKYDGDWKDDKKHGKGVYNFNNGDEYDGDWKDGKVHGKGVLIYGPNNVHQYDEYDGDWKDGKKHGKGVYYYFDEGHKYEGDWDNNQRHGKGVLINRNKKFHEGDWIRDQPVSSIDDETINPMFQNYIEGGKRKTRKSKKSIKDLEKLVQKDREEEMIVILMIQRTTMIMIYCSNFDDDR